MKYIISYSQMANIVNSNYFFDCFIIKRWFVLNVSKKQCSLNKLVLYLFISLKDYYVKSKMQLYDKRIFKSLNNWGLIQKRLVT